MHVDILREYNSRFYQALNHKVREWEFYSRSSEQYCKLSFPVFVESRA